MTIPVLQGSSKEAELVTGLLKFHSTLSQAVMMWRNNTGAIDIAGSDADVSMFDSIAKELKYTAKCVKSECATVSWLPDYSYDYLGVKGTNVSFGAVAKNGYGNACYLLADGMTFCLDINPNNYCVTVDVNGKKKPNRVGRDIFSFTVGYNGHDVTPEELHCSNNPHAVYRKVNVMLQIWTLRKKEGLLQHLMFFSRKNFLRYTTENNKKALNNIKAFLYLEFIFRNDKRLIVRIFIHKFKIIFHSFVFGFIIEFI